MSSTSDSSVVAPEVSSVKQLVISLYASVSISVFSASDYVVSTIVYVSSVLSTLYSYYDPYDTEFPCKELVSSFVVIASDYVSVLVSPLSYLIFW